MTTLDDAGNGIVWEDPPERVRRGGKPSIWARRVAPLREHPGRWAHLGRFDAATAANIKNGKLGGGAIRPGEFETANRNFDDATKTSDLYVRYVGDEATDVTA